MQQRDGGMISQGKRGGIIQTIETIVLSQMSMRKPITLNYPFCLMHPIIYFFQKLVEVVNALGMERYGSQNLYWGPSFLGNHFFAYGARKHPKIGAHSIIHPCVSLPHTTGDS